MKVEINGKVFDLSFSNDPSGHTFTISDGERTSIHKIRYITNWSVIRSIAKKFNMLESEIDNLRNGLIWKILSAYEQWHKEKQKK